MIKKEQPEQVKHLFIFPSKWLLAGKTFIRYWYSHTQISPPAALQCLGSLGGQYFYYRVLMSTVRNTRVDDVSQRQVMGLFRVSSAPSGQMNSPHHLSLGPLTVEVSRSFATDIGNRIRSSINCLV